MIGSQIGVVCPSRLLFVCFHHVFVDGPGTFAIAESRLNFGVCPLGRVCTLEIIPEKNQESLQFVRTRTQRAKFGKNNFDQVGSQSRACQVRLHICPGRELKGGWHQLYYGDGSWIE